MGCVGVQGRDESLHHRKSSDISKSLSLKDYYFRLYYAQLMYFKFAKYSFAEKKFDIKQRI